MKAKTNSPIYVYARAAIDFWDGWIPEGELANALLPEEDATNELSDYRAFRKHAYDLARRIGWEGDITVGPYVAGLPTDESGVDGYVMIAWKQGNNGDTFVASPFRLPWLEGGDYGRWIDSEGRGKF